VSERFWDEDVGRILKNAWFDDIRQEVELIIKRQKQQLNDVMLGRLEVEPCPCECLCECCSGSADGDEE
jgi:hypothetical protein